MKELTKEVNFQQTKFTNLEAHSRRDSLVFFGLEEGMETGSPDKMMNEILCYILDLEEGGTTPEVERQHRSLHPRPAPTEPPRPYIVHMFRWSDWQKILGAGYDDIRGKLLRAELRNGLLYPSRLIVTIGDIK